MDRAGRLYLTRVGGCLILRVLVLALALVGAVRAQEEMEQSLLPSPARELNRQLPNWIRLGGEYRSRMEHLGALRFIPENDDTYLLSRVRLNLDLQPSSWLGFSFQVHDARVYGNHLVPDAPLFQDPFDLRLGYVKLGDSEKNRFALHIGRQDIIHGEQRLVGISNWANSARSFDAIRLYLRQGNYKVQIFSSAEVRQRAQGFNRPVPGDNFHGYYGGITNLVPRSSIEPYGYWRVAPHAVAENGSTGKLDFKTWGFRMVGQLPSRFDYKAEMALQRGHWGGDPLSAWAGHWLLGHAFPVRYTPRVSVEYDYASGDRDPQDNRRRTFQLIYPTPHDKYGLSDQVGWKNVHHVGSVAEFHPRPKITLQAKYQTWWRASLMDGVYNAPGNLLVPAQPGAGRHIGHELDLQAIFNWGPPADVSTGVAHVFPSTFLRNASPGGRFTFFYSMLTYRF